MKKILATIICMLLITAMMVSACAPAPDEQPAQTNDGATAEQPAAADDDDAPPADTTSGGSGDLVLGLDYIERGNGPTVVYFGAGLTPADSGMYALIEEFLNQNPNVEARFEFQGAEHDEARRRLKLMAATNELPHMFWESYGEVIEMAEMGLLANLNTIFDNDAEFYNFFYQGAFDMLTYDGIIHAFPDKQDAMGFWFNTQLFDQFGLDIPVTEDEFLHAISVFRDNDILPIAHGGVDMWAVWGYNLFFHRYGYMEHHQAFLDKEWTFTDGGMIRAYERIKEWADAGAFPENVTTMSHSEASSLFQAGNAAMHTSGSWMLNAFSDPEETPISDYIAFNWGPEFDDSPYNQKAGLKEFSTGTFISQNLADDPDAFEVAIAFNRWRFSPEGTEFFVEEWSGLSASKYHGDGSRIPRLSTMMLDMLGDEYLPYYQLAVIHDSTFQEPFWNSVTAVISGVITPEEAARQVDNWNERR